MRAETICGSFVGGAEGSDTTQRLANVQMVKLAVRAGDSQRSTHTSRNRPTDKLRTIFPVAQTLEPVASSPTSMPTINLVTTPARSRTPNWTSTPADSVASKLRAPP